MNIPKNIRDQIPKSEEEKEKDELIERFKSRVSDTTIDIDTLIDRYLLFGNPYIFKGDEDKYYSLKKKVAQFFNIQQTQVYIVGSAKLGFSISPTKRFKYFDDESDIDIAVIDETVFMEYWRTLYKVNSKIKARTEEEENNFKEFKDFLLKGWLRPDKFPVEQRKEWFDFFKSIQPEYKHDIRVGLYHDFYFFNDYNRKNLYGLRRELKDGL